MTLFYLNITLTSLSPRPVTLSMISPRSPGLLFFVFLTKEKQRRGQNNSAIILSLLKMKGFPQEPRRRAPVPWHQLRHASLSGTWQLEGNRNRIPISIFEHSRAVVREVVCILKYHPRLSGGAILRGLPRADSDQTQRSHPPGVFTSSPKSEGRPGGNFHSAF